MFPSTTLYRYYDADGSLLYVGITDSISRRAHQHHKNAQWHEFAVSAKLEHFQNRDDALRAESKAIREEEPVYNIAGSNQFDRDYEQHWLDLKAGDLKDPIHLDVLQYIVDGIQSCKVDELSSDKIKSFFTDCLDDIYDNRIPCIACRTLAATKEFKDAEGVNK
jgi:predicted GIY-YIG superfamily endonuclease